MLNVGLVIARFLLSFVHHPGGISVCPCHKLSCCIMLYDNYNPHYLLLPEGVFLDFSFLQTVTRVK